MAAEGTYYGDDLPSPEELESPDGRQRMKVAVFEMLRAAEASGASPGLLQRMRDDLAVLDRN